MAIVSDTTEPRVPGKAGQEAEESKSVQSTKKKRPTLTKVVIRRLPKGMTGNELLEQLQPLSSYGFFYFARADSSMDPWNYSRAYFGFVKDEDVISFRDRFDGYVFVDSQGNESTALVELAPNLKIPKHSAEKAKINDSKSGTIEQDADYLKYLEERDNAESAETKILSLEERLREIDDKATKLKAVQSQETPLIKYLFEKRQNKWIKEEERKKRVIDRLERERKEREEEKLRLKALKQKASADKEKEKSEQQSSSKSTKDRTETLKTDLHTPIVGGERDGVRKKNGGKRGDRDGREERTSSSSASQKSALKGSVNVEKTRTKTTTRPRVEKAPRFEKEDKNKEDDGKSGNFEASKSESKKSSRRSRDRPERAIYQPGAKKRTDTATGAGKEGQLAEKEK